MQNNPLEQKLLNALGLCQKARKLIVGTPMICDALKQGKPIYAVITAADNSQNTQKRLSDRCAYYGVPLIVTEISGDRLSDAIGKCGRVSAAAVADENLAKPVMNAAAAIGDTL